MHLLLELLLHLFSHPFLGHDDLFDVRLSQLSLPCLLSDFLFLITELSLQLGDLRLHDSLNLHALLPSLLQFSLKSGHLLLERVHGALLFLQGLPQF